MLPDRARRDLKSTRLGLTRRLMLSRICRKSYRERYTKGTIFQPNSVIIAGTCAKFQPLDGGGTSDNNGTTLHSVQ